MSVGSMIMSDKFVHVVFANGKSVTLNKGNEQFDSVIAALRNGDWARAESVAFPANAVTAAIAKSGPSSKRVIVEGGQVLVDGTPLHNTLTSRMLQMVCEGFDINPMIKFLTNLLDNPSYRAVNELYGFLESTKLPITEDGHFIAYKRIRSDWTDQYTGKMDNSIGSVLEMPRNSVDEDANRTCSAGLHFCGRDYLEHYGSKDGGRVVMVKINPRDVVAIPTDYMNQKGRACRYEIVGELDLQEKRSTSLPVERLEEIVVAPETVHLLKLSTPDNVEAEYFLTPQDATKFSTLSQANLTVSGINRVIRGERKTIGGMQCSYVTVALAAWEEYERTGIIPPGFEDSAYSNAPRPVEGYDFSDDWADEDDWDE